MRTVHLLTAALMLIAFRSARAAEFLITDSGAAADEKTVCTKAIQSAIEKAAEAGGGDVIVPRGTFFTGAIFLKSNVNLRVDEGATLRAVEDDAAYPPVATRIAGIEITWPAALINVYKQDHCRIYGKGTIDGSGPFWWKKFWGDGKSRGLQAEYVDRGLRWAADYDCQRPRMIELFETSDSSVEGLTLRQSAFWTVHVCYSKNVVIDGLTIRNNEAGRGHSTDGIDIDSSTDCLVQKCDIDCNDDAICLKAGRDFDGLRVNRPTERIVIRDCIARASHGLITLGSETSGGIRNIEAYRLKAMRDTSAGVRIKSARTRGGTIEDIYIHDIELAGVARPFEFDLNWMPDFSLPKLPRGIDEKTIPPHWKTLLQRVDPPERGIPHFRNVRIENVVATDANEAFFVNGLATAPFETFTFKNVSIAAKKAGSIARTKRWTFDSVRINSKEAGKLKFEESEGFIGELP